MIAVKWSRINRQEDKVIIVCSGPSLKDFDFNRLKGRGYIIAVNGAGGFVPFADMWFTLDPWGLGTGKQLPRPFLGELWAAVPPDFGTNTAHYSDHRIMPTMKINYLHRIPFSGNLSPTEQQAEYLNWKLNEDSSCINTGNSGFGAFNVAYHMNPKKILLLGIDASQGYFYQSPKGPRPFDLLIPLFKSTVAQTKKKNIKVLNGSPVSRIDAYPLYSIDEALKIF